MTPDGDLVKDLLPLEVSNNLCDAEVSTYFGFLSYNCYRTQTQTRTRTRAHKPNMYPILFFIVFSIVFYRTFDRVFHRTIIVLFENRMSVAILFII